MSLRLKAILLPWPTECWDYMCEPNWPAWRVVWPCPIGPRMSVWWSFSLHKRAGHRQYMQTNMSSPMKGRHMGIYRRKGKKEMSIRPDSFAAPQTKSVVKGRVWWLWELWMMAKWIVAPWFSVGEREMMAESFSVLLSVINVHLPNEIKGKTVFSLTPALFHTAS